MLLINEAEVLRVWGCIPWAALTEYDGGRLGSVGISSSSPTLAEAHDDARQWLEDHPPRDKDAFMRPSSVIKIAYRNAITGELE